MGRRGSGSGSPPGKKGLPLRRAASELSRRPHRRTRRTWLTSATVAGLEQEGRLSDHQGGPLMILVSHPAIRGDRPAAVPGRRAPWSWPPFPSLHRTPAALLRCPDPPEPGCCRTPGRTGFVEVASRVHNPPIFTKAVMLRSQPGLTGSGSPIRSYSGFGGGHPHFRLNADCRQPDLTELNGQLRSAADGHPGRRQVASGARVCYPDPRTSRPVLSLRQPRRPPLHRGPRAPVPCRSATLRRRPRGLGPQPGTWATRRSGGSVRLSCRGLAGRPEPRACPGSRGLGGAVACPWQALSSAPATPGTWDHARIMGNRLETG